jgi:hypothetical protein
MIVQLLESRSLHPRVLVYDFVYFCGQYIAVKHPIIAQKPTHCLDRARPAHAVGNLLDIEFLEKGFRI